MKATTIHLATTAANEDEEPNALTEEEEEEVADDLEYSAGSKDSLVRPPIFLLTCVVLTCLVTGQHLVCDGALDNLGHSFYTEVRCPVTSSKRTAIIFQ